MNISVVGASGDIGREIITKLVETRAMDHEATLQLVGRAEGRSAGFLTGLMSDILDAHAEISPQLEIALDPQAVRGDLVIFCAGQTMPTDPRFTTDRNALAEGNAPIFYEYAEAIAKNGHPEQIIIIVSNPVELAVHIFAKFIDSRRVIGMGAFLDTIRFRREIAEDLGVRRQRIRGLVVGQHGAGMVPLWSTVGAYGFDSKEGQAKIDGEFLGVHSVIGVPILLSNQGITEILPLKIWDEEEREFKRSAERINEFLAKY